VALKIKKLKNIKKRGVVKTALGTHFARTLLNLAMLDSRGSFSLILFVKSKSKNNYEFASLIKLFYSLTLDH